MKYFIILILLLSGCDTGKDKYDVTCWSGGQVIYKEILYNDFWRWTTLEGSKVVMSNNSGMACISKYIGTYVR